MRTLFLFLSLSLWGRPDERRPLERVTEARQERARKQRDREKRRKDESVRICRREVTLEGRGRRAQVNVKPGTAALCSPPTPDEICKLGGRGTFQPVVKGACDARKGRRARNRMRERTKPTDKDELTDEKEKLEARTTRWSSFIVCPLVAKRTSGRAALLVLVLVSAERTAAHRALDLSRAGVVSHYAVIRRHP
ncbi:hypothetical protein LY76DRAFT_608161 [Colletotrichum caudatum]|nr:hypothetical protein LY76DRAFT_608161 [Colletotrichum caudatum]